MSLPMTDIPVYALLIAALAAITGALGVIAGGRFRLAALVVTGNYAVSLWASLAGLTTIDFMMLSSALDLAAVAAITHAQRSRPTAFGLYMAGTAMVLSLISHWAVFVSFSLTGQSYNLAYFLTTNTSMIIACLGLIWTGVIILGARYGLGVLLPDPFGFCGNWRIPVGAAKRKGAETWKT